jgi:NADH-quinone oxidoreductase subunit L
MTIPLAVLAVLALVGGAVSLWPEPLGAVLRAVPEAGAPAHATVGAAGTAAFAIGLVFAMIFYRFGAADDRLEQDARPVFKLLAGRLWFDEIYLWYVHNVQDRLAQLAAFLEHLFISGLFVRGSAAAAGLAGLVAKATITGDLHTYVAWFFAGLVILWWSIMGN